MVWIVLTAALWLVGALSVTWLLVGLPMLWLTGIVYRWVCALWYWQRR